MYMHRDRQREREKKNKINAFYVTNETLETKEKRQQPPHKLIMARCVTYQKLNESDEIAVFVVSMFR